MSKNDKFLTEKVQGANCDSDPTQVIGSDTQPGSKEDLRPANMEQINQETKIPDYKNIIFSSVVPGLRTVEGVQVSQINMCDRRNIFKIIEPIQESPGEKIRMATGIAMHSYTLKRILRSPDPTLFEAERQVKFKSFIFGNIDWYDMQVGVAIEIKIKIVEDPKWKVTPFPSHVQQLKDLMAMGNIANGALVYIVIGGDESIVQFNYQMDKVEREQQLKMLEKRATKFLNAKVKRDPSLAQHVFFNKDLRWLCDRIDKKTGEHIWCPYYWKCMSLITKERTYDDRYSPESNLVNQTVIDG